MPLVRSALIATAACLFGAAAYAQPSTTYQSAPPPPMSSDMNSAPSASQMPDNAPSASPATAQVGTAANTSTTVDANGTQVIASQPVPDTPANRRAFGAPLSHAGKHTAPRGN